MAQQTPRVRITTPTSAKTYTTTTTPLMVKGTASDNRQVTKVTWVTDRGGSGTAQGTTSWSASIPLQAGVNKITVRAVDDRGKEGQDTVTVTLTTPPSSNGPITLFWSWEGTGESFQVERCMQTAQGCLMAFLTTRALTERQWTDTAVQAAQRYCYRLTVVTQGTHGEYSNTLCST